VALPQFAGQKLQILEVFVGGSASSPSMLDAKGSVYSFDADGFLNMQPAVEAIVNVIKGSKPRLVQPNVIDIGPAVRHRRWTAENMWRPSQPLLQAVADDLRQSSSAAKIRILKP
jgi:hypothetical protein